MRTIKENIESRNLGRILDQDESAKRKVLTEVWNRTGYLYGLEGRDAANMAVMLETQKKQNLKESTTTADMAIFDTIAIPMIRRQYNAMITPLIVSVQPLSQPHGVVFFMDYKVSSTKLPIRSDYLGSAATTTALGSDNGFAHMDGNSFESVSAYDRFYNNKGFDTSKGKVIDRGWNAGGHAIHTTDSGNVASFAAVADLGGSGVQQTAVIDFNLAAVGGLKMDSLASFEVSVYNNSTPSSGAKLVHGVDYVWQAVSQNYPVEFGSTAFGSPNDPATSSTNIMGGPRNYNNVFRIQLVPIKQNLGDVWVKLGFKQYLNLELFPAFSAEMKMVISRQTIDTQIHKLKTGWTVEFAQDLMSYYAIDAETELTQALAEEIAAEKDRMVIQELVTGAAHLRTWNADFANAVDPNPAGTVFRGLQGDYNQSLVYEINAIDGMIRKATKKGGANFIVISTEGFTKLRNMSDFRIDVNTDDVITEFAGGVVREGTLTNKITVYVDPNLPAQICLVGRKGTSFFDTGYVYAPYIEYLLSDAVEDQDFNKRKMISSRFGTAMLNNKFYGVVFMYGIEEFNALQPELVNNAH